MVSPYNPITMKPIKKSGSQEQLNRERIIQKIHLFLGDMKFSTDVEKLDLIIKVRSPQKTNDLRLVV